MKPINIIICTLMLSVHGYAQTFTLSESLADAYVAAQKATINGQLLSLSGLTLEQKNYLIDLKHQEDRYADKRTPISNLNPSVSLITGAIEYTLNDTSAKISNVEHNLNVFKFASLGMYGLGLQRSALQREKKYLTKLQEENETLRQGLLFSGSAGDNYTVRLKLLIKLVEIKNRVMVIDKEVKARMKITRFLAR